MVDFEVITVFIKIVKDYMNKEADLYKNKSEKINKNAICFRSCVKKSARSYLIICSIADF